MTKQQVATREEAPETPVSESMALMRMIEGATRDPSVDVVKMRELRAMHKEIMAEVAQREFDDALAAAQGEMRPIATDASNTHTKSKYATYHALDKALRPIYIKHGFSVSFDMDESPKGNEFVRVLAIVSGHGHRQIYKRDMPVTTKGPAGKDLMTPIHATASAESYGRRYLLGGIFNIAIGSDDDGNAAGAGDPITDDQVKEIRRLIDLYGAEEPKILAHAAKLAGIEIEKIEDMPARVYDRTVAALTDWARKQRGAV